MKNYKRNFMIVGILVFVPLFAYAHPGRTDSSGCHTCRTNCSSWGLSTGEYHCHTSKGVSQPVAPIKSTYGENATGYTTPAPEYGTPKVNVQTNVKIIEKKSWFSRFLSWFKN